MTLLGSENRTTHVLNHAAFSNYNRLFHAPWSDLSACRTDDMSWRTYLVVYKQMQSNPIISFRSQSFKVVEFSQLVCSGILFTQIQRNVSIHSLHKNDDATWVTNSFLLEGSSLVHSLMLVALCQPKRSTLRFRWTVCRSHILHSFNIIHNICTVKLLWVKISLQNVVMLSRVEHQSFRHNTLSSV